MGADGAGEYWQRAREAGALEFGAALQKYYNCRLMPLRVKGIRRAVPRLKLNVFCASSINVKTLSVDVKFMLINSWSIFSTVTLMVPA